MIRIDFIIEYLTKCKSVERWKMIIWTINCLFIGGIIKAVKEFKNEPAMINNKLIQVKYRPPVNFKLYYIDD